MHKTRLLSLALTTALMVMALSASTASAKISFEWFVGGSLLKEKETRAFDGTSDGHVADFHTTLDGINILMLASQGSLEGAVIIGGRPGTGEGTLVFEDVTVDKTGCTAESIPNPVPGTIRTRLLKGEIVEGENGEVLILFTPKVAGEPFTTLLLLGSSCTGANIPAEVTGSILALPSPQRTEVLRGDLVAPAVTDLYLLVNGESKPLLAGLTFGGNAATLTGLVLVLLTNDAIAGPF